MKFTITFILLGLLLTGCGRNNAKVQQQSDAMIQQQLTGTWDELTGTRDETRDYFKSTRVLSPSGSFEFQIAGTNGIIVKEEGTLLAKAGDLIVTVTNDSRTNASLMLQGLHGRILLLNEQDLVVRWDGIDIDSFARKVKK